MKAEPQIQTKVTSSGAPVRSGFIQRKCACGGSASPAGACQACKKQEHPLQRHPAGHNAPYNHARWTAKPSHPISEGKSDARFGHSLSNVAIHTKAEPARGPHDHTADDGATATPDHPHALLEQLGAGQAFGGNSRSRMESVFRRDFSQVRVHVDSDAAQLSNRLNAQAFTIGNHIAFAAGRYQPGTVTGDALLAHELAHVSQQSSANTSDVAMQSEGPAYDALERDADVAAAHAVVSLWGRAKGLATGAVQSAMPRMQSGLRLSLAACKSEDKTPSAPTGEKKAATCTDICNRAYADASLNSGGGGVICDGATKCACVFDVPPATKGECPDLDADVLAHETGHLGDVDCDATKGLHRPPFRDQAQATASECSHRTTSVAKLDAAIKTAAEPCKTKLTTIKAGLDSWIKANCGP